MKGFRQRLVSAPMLFKEPKFWRLQICCFVAFPKLQIDFNVKISLETGNKLEIIVKMLNGLLAQIVHIVFQVMLLFWYLIEIVWSIY